MEEDDESILSEVCGPIYYFSGPLLLTLEPSLQPLLKSLLSNYLLPPHALALCSTCHTLLPFRAALTTAVVTSRRRLSKLLSLVNRGLFPSLTSLKCVSASSQHALGSIEARMLASHLSAAPTAITTLQQQQQQQQQPAATSPRARIKRSLQLLQSLSLCNQEFGEDGMVQLLRSLGPSALHLTVLCLDGTPLWPLGFGALAEALGYSSTTLRLHTLSLRSCKATSQDMSALASALPTTLRALHLSDNPFLDEVEGMQALVGGGGAAPSSALAGLQQLSLGGNVLHSHLSTASMRALCTALHSRGPFPAAPPAATAIATAAAAAPSGNNRTHLLPLLVTNLKRMPVLRELDLWHSQLDDSGARSLAVALDVLLGGGGPLEHLSVDVDAVSGTGGWAIIADAIIKIAKEQQQEGAAHSSSTTLTLRSLKLGNDAPSVDQCTAVGRMARQETLPRLQDLDLSGSKMESAGVEALVREAQLLQSSPLLRSAGGGGGMSRAVRVLKLGGVSMGGGRALQALMMDEEDEQWRTGRRAEAPVSEVEVLNLSDNGIDYRGAITIARALSRGRLPRLRVLDLSCNRLHRRGASVIIHACRDPPHPNLCRVLLYVNGLGHTDLEEVGVEIWTPGPPDRLRKALKV